MQTLVSIQQWLYQSMGQGLGDVAGGSARGAGLAMLAAVLFGGLHALMPGHGKTVLVSYHLGQESRPMESFTNGAILALTHVGLAVLLVLAGFAVISKAFAYGGRTPQFETASGALIVLIGAFLLWRSLQSDHEASTKRNRRTLAFVTGMIPCPAYHFHYELCVDARHSRRRTPGDRDDDRRHDRGHWRRGAGRLPDKDPLHDAAVTYGATERPAWSGGSLAVLGLGLWTLVRAAN